MLEQLPTDPSSSVLYLFQPVHPVINRDIQLSKCLFLLQLRLVAELGNTRRAQILADTRVEVPTTYAERIDLKSLHPINSLLLKQRKFSLLILFRGIDLLRAGGKLLESLLLRGLAIL
ncbi:hypothetical protein N0V84_011282 [Fusarium piperis]|uniref:Uncharacterized protein n=1 Tax=Fusarium piperis TaxID=1435070 RepID=A0A9W8TAR4_9HYPO|nr:hypothetical protein N0V84_011282 [Fusarium piperis]